MKIAIIFGFHVNNIAKYTLKRICFTDVFKFAYFHLKLIEYVFVLFCSKFPRNENYFY